MSLLTCMDGLRLGINKATSMIVNYSELGWQIISQRSHGLLAAQICAHWSKEKQPKRWVDTLIATAEHDDEFNELENNDLLNETGGPLNFKQTAFKLEHSQRLINMAEMKSSYISLLISRHIQFVHGEDPKAKAFISELRKREKVWLKTSGSSTDDVDRGYELLEFCDAFSLLICQGLVQPENRKIEISKGPDGTSYEMYAFGDGVVVNPWPFEVSSFSVTWELRTVSQLSFKDITEFRKVFVASPVTSHQLKLLKRP